MNKLSKIIALYQSVLTSKEELCVFGSWWGNKFADNPKFLYLYFLKSGIRSVWITKNADVYKKMKEKSLPVYMANSSEGIACCKKARYVFYCTGVSDVNEYYIGGAYLINLWHGIPLKKVMYDDKINNSHRSIKSRAWSIVTKIPYRKSYVVSTSDTISRIYESAFKVNCSHILQWGQPRNDCFFDTTLKKSKFGQIEYRKMILYMPTHRNEGNQEIHIERIFVLDQLEKYCGENNVLFVIKKHYYHRGEFIDLSRYPHIIDITQNDFDTQELLFNADILITDYSSCYIDYLLLERPIIFYAYDYEQYVQKDREMYFAFDDVTPGPHVICFDELLHTLKNIDQISLEYLKKYHKVKRIFYSEQTEGQVSGRILKMMRTLKG